MLPPLPRCSGRAHSSLKLAHPYHPSPKPLSGRPAHRPFRGLLGVHSRCGLHTRAVTKIVTVIRRLQTFRRLHACSGCFRLERSPGGPCTHWKSAALSRRTWKADTRWVLSEGRFRLCFALVNGEKGLSNQRCFGLGAPFVDAGPRGLDGPVLRRGGGGKFSEVGRQPGPTSLGQQCGAAGQLG